jgi:tRNA A37 methylthiotransferase MiaB
MFPSPGVASERAAQAAALGETLLQRYASRFVGRDASVLVEKSKKDGKDGGNGGNIKKIFLSGYTRNFVAALVEAGKTISEAEKEAGSEVEARMTGCVKGELRGVQL